VGAGLTGALLVLAADVVAQRVLAPNQLAVGVVTGALGGIYLIVLLASRWRRSR
jgi:iron complex transport system permease protein